MGDVIGDINARRGQVVELTDRNGLKQVESTVPLANMFQVRACIPQSLRGGCFKSTFFVLVPPPPSNQTHKNRFPPEAIRVALLVLVVYFIFFFKCQRANNPVTRPRTISSSLSGELMTRQALYCLVMSFIYPPLYFGEGVH